MVGAISFLPLNELPALFPHVVGWISYLEKQARESGRPLTPIELNLAQNVGVAHPEQVRILFVPRIPRPRHPRVKQLARQVGLLNTDTGGLTAGHGIIVGLDCADNLRWLAHEFVHVAQYEQLGTQGFLQEYIQQIAAHGYQNAPFELEAEAKASNACRVETRKTVGFAGVRSSTYWYRVPDLGFSFSELITIVSRTRRVDTLLWPIELLRIAKQHRTCGGLRNCGNVRQGHLARFVDMKF